MSDVLYFRDGTNVPKWMPSGPILNYLPAVAELIPARDAALERWVMFLIDNDHLLRSDWQQAAEQRDREAAKKAVADGKDPMRGSNAVVEAAGKRARAQGAAAALADAVRELDAEILAHLRPAAADAVGQVASDLDAAQQEYEEAHAAAMQARARFTQLAYQRHWVDAVQQGRGWPDVEFRSNGAIGAGPYERGAEETRIVRQKLDDLLNHEPRVAVDVDGTTKHLPASLAEELISAGAAKRM